MVGLGGVRIESRRGVGSEKEMEADSTAVLRTLRTGGEDLFLFGA